MGRRKTKDTLLILKHIQNKAFQTRGFPWSKRCSKIPHPEENKCRTSEQQANKSSDSGSMKDKELSRDKDTKSQHRRWGGC